MTLNSINDTISAIATPLGTGGVGVIRISGAGSLQVISRIFSASLKTKNLPEFSPNSVYHGWIINPQDNRPVDEVIIVVFRAPRSYTGEDVIEIHCHGGVNIVKNILSLTLSQGARLAEKGEFTKRGFLNGKLDLSKAEAVLDLIHSKTDRFSQVSAHNLSGRLAQNILSIRTELLNLLSEITAAIDFPEEVAEPDYTVVETRVNGLIAKIDRILGTAKSSNLMRQGIKLAIVGKPNVGKSSLFNSLLNMQRAIVTDIPGTTRDVIQESLDIDGIPVTLVDTAGLREIKNIHSSDFIESIGIDITRNYIKDADLILFVTEVNGDLQPEDRLILDEIGEKPKVVVGSKSDLADGNISPAPEIMVKISSKTGEGLENLKTVIKKAVHQNDAQEECEFSTNIRQQECLNNAKTSLVRAVEGVRGGELQDLISIDLKSALIFLGEITGEVVTEEILDNVFSNFCIGK